MKIKNLHIKNIGPFKEAALEFATDFVQVTGEQPVTIITGVNGAGKSILIDAIRAALSGTLLERNIVADENDFVVEMDIDDQGKVRHLTTSQIERGHIKYADWAIANPLQYGYENTDFIYPWVIDYWASQSPSDPFRIMNMTNIKHKEVLKGVMWGKKSNVDLVNFICHVDYLRTSEVPAEQQLGALMYERLKRIVKLCLDNGGFKYVRRSDLTPIVEQNGMRYHNIPSITKYPDVENINKFLKLVDNIKKSGGKVHIHCKAGADRTGMYSFIYKQLNNLGNINSNTAEMLKMGHNYQLYPDLLPWIKNFLNKFITKK